MGGREWVALGGHRHAVEAFVSPATQNRSASSPRQWPLYFDGVTLEAQVSLGPSPAVPTDTDHCMRVSEGEKCTAARPVFVYVSKLMVVGVNLQACISYGSMESIKHKHPAQPEI